VIGWIARGRIGPDDRISPVGGEESALADHPDFRGCFIPGSADEQEIARLRQEFRDVERRANVRKIISQLGAVGFLAVAGAAVFFGMNSRVMVFPEPILEKVEQGIELAQSVLNPVVEYEFMPQASELPHADWVAAQGSAGDATSFHRGEAQFWLASSNELELARRHYLAAIANAPGDPMAHAGLMEVNSEMLATRPELLGEIARAAVRLDSIQAKGPAMNRATAALALAKGNRLGAAESTKECRNIDVGCRLIHGEATQSVDEVDRVGQQVGPLSRVLRVLSRTAFVAEDWTTLNTATLELTERVPTDPIGYQLRAEYMAAIGQWEEARQYATRARELGSESPATMHLEAALTVQVERDSKHGLALYQRLAENPLLPGYSGRLSVLVQGALVGVQAGDLDAARSMNTASLDMDSESPDVMMTNALIEFAAGEQEAAESILRNVVSSDLDRDDAAKLHLWSAYIYLDGGKQRLARTELDEAKRLRPSWPRLFHEIVWAEFQSKNIKNVVDAIQAICLTPPAGGLRTDPRTAVGFGEPPYRRFTGQLLRSMDADIRYERLREPVAAIFGWTSRRVGALDHMLDANEDFPDNIGLQAAIAAAQFENGYWEDSVSNSLAVVGRLPSTKWMQSIRGRALAKLGRWNEAKDVLRRSTRGGVNDVRLIQWAAEAWISQGELKEGRTLLEEAQKSHPKDVILRRALLALEEGKE